MSFASNSHCLRLTMTPYQRHVIAELERGGSTIKLRLLGVRQNPSESLNTEYTTGGAYEVQFSHIDFPSMRT